MRTNGTQNCTKKTATQTVQENEMKEETEKYLDQTFTIVLLPYKKVILFR